MALVQDGASELPRSKPKTASPKRFAWRLYPFTTTSPTWATITALNAPATVPSKPPRTPLINSPASFIISLKLGSLMMKLFLQSLKLVTKNTVCTSYKLSLGKWVTHSCRPMRDPQFLERDPHVVYRSLPLDLRRRAWVHVHGPRWTGLHSFHISCRLESFQKDRLPCRQRCGGGRRQLRCNRLARGLEILQ